MLCEEISEQLIESAREEREPGRILRTHMRVCETCRDRWEAQQSLSLSMRGLRAASSVQRSSLDSHDALMRQFAHRHRPRFARQWYWGLAAAAALVISILTVPDLERRLRGPAVAPISEPQAIAQSSSWPEIPADPDADGFIAVPFVPPLATGEMVRIVHTELNPAALATLGVSVDPSWTTQLPADVLLGQDGMPRAVRVSEADNGGF
jgi:hypothetical protein